MAKPRPPLPTPPRPDGGQVCQFVKYTHVTVHRSELKNAPYNPRKITERAKARLKKNIEKVGLLAPITWNSRTGNIVGGHQRIAVLDALMDTSDYRVPVSQVDLDPKTEREQNVFMNNPEAQGEFDLAQLESLFKGADAISAEAAGFDAADVFQLFGDSPIIEQPEALSDLSEKIRAAQAAQDKIHSTNANRDEVDFYCVVVFKDDEHRQQFRALLGLPDVGLGENKYVDGKYLIQKLSGEK